MLSLSHLRKSFGSTLAVDDLSLDLKPGEVFGLLGPNGAGKSTTINMAVGLVRPDSGRVELHAAGQAPGDPYANCDQSSAAPTLNINDFVCFATSFVSGCP